MRNVFTGMIATAALFAVAGCCSQKQQCNKCCSKEGYNDPWFPEFATHVYDQAAYQQAASAARKSSTLWDMHFHGAALNSLGEDKLSLMFDDDDQSKPHVIYLDTTGDDAVSALQAENVKSFAIRGGVDPESIKIERGPNPNDTTATAPLLKNYNKTETTGDTGSIGGGTK